MWRCLFSFLVSNTVVWKDGGVWAGQKNAQSAEKKKIKQTNKQKNWLVCDYQFRYRNPVWPISMGGQQPTILFCLFCSVNKAYQKVKKTVANIAAHAYVTAHAQMWSENVFPGTVLFRARGGPFLPRARQGAVYTSRGSNREDKCRQKSSLKPKIKLWTQQRISKFRR